MNKFIYFFLIVLLFYTPLSARNIDINKLINSATKTDKHLLVWFHKTDCGYCDSMKEFTLDDKTVKTLVKKKFLFVHINVYEKDRVRYKDFVGSGRDFAKFLGFDFYPTSLFFDNSNDVIYKAVGYHDEIEFHQVLKFIETKSYLKMDYETFENDYDFKKDL
nr:thioredoxin fold domain-containing protein [uncultured Sulfurimonas sp.]